MKRILYIVLDAKLNKINKETKESINSILEKEDSYVFIEFNDIKNNELYFSLKESVNKIINDINNFDYICLIPNGSILNKETKIIFNEYQNIREDGVKEIYLPFSLYVEEDTTVIMNKHLWNSALAYEAGVLDLELATRQIDSTIFGSFIPTELFFNEEFYNKEIQYYQQYHILNNFADKYLVLSIPKILLTINNWDFKLSNVDNEEKIKYFKMARKDWQKIKTN